MAESKGGANQPDASDFAALEKELAAGIPDGPLPADGPISLGPEKPKAGPARTSSGGGGAKKKKKKLEPKTPLLRRITTAWREARKAAAEVTHSLGSTDPPTRRMAWVFVAALGGAVLVVSIAGSRYWHHWSALHSERRAVQLHEEAMLSGFLKKQADLMHRKRVMLPLGSFTLELRQPAGGTPANLNLADVEIVVECDTKETRTYLEDNLAQARNQVTNVFVAIDRGELLSADGKARLKKSLLDSLNASLPKGRIENLYISKLVLS